MKLRNWILGGVGIALAIALAAAPTAPITQPAQAATQMLCQGDVSGASTGARVVVNTSSTASPQPQYVLNSQGCAQINLADVGFFLSQGFTQGSPFQTVVFNTGVATGTTDFVIGTIPANAYIQAILFSNSVAAAVTGGISIGTTANGTDVVAAQACAASCVTFTTDALTLKRNFSTTAGTALHAAAVTAWNSANVTITVVYGFF
jgi:hypothetical protein